MYIVTYKMSLLEQEVYSEEIDDEVFGNREVTDISYKEIQNELWRYRKEVGCCLPDDNVDEFVILSVTKLK